MESENMLFTDSQNVPYENFEDDSRHLMLSYKQKNFKWNIVTRKVILYDQYS